MIKCIFMTTIAMLSLQLWADDNNHYHQEEMIESFELVQVVETPGGLEYEIPLGSQKKPDFINLSNSNPVSVVGDLKDIIMMTKDLIALGKEIYKIIEAGKPVVTVSTAPIEILPRDEAGALIDAFQLENWKEPVSVKYRVKAKNYLGMNPIVFEFIVIFTYGGSYNGHGAYITGAQIKPTNLDVLWGFDFSAEFKVQTIMNQGTSVDPIAGAVLSLDYKVNTVFQDRQQSKMFFINGHGKITAY